MEWPGGWKITTTLQLGSAEYSVAFALRVGGAQQERRRESLPFLHCLGWEIVANEAMRLPIAEAVPIYEQLLSTFPTAAKYWKQYVEAHMAVNNDDATKQIFSRCLLNCLQIPLWRCYIRFIRKVNDKRGTEGQEETKKAYEFMLNYVGADIASGPVWMEYIAYLKSLPTLTAQDESQRMTAVRKAYQRAIVTPTHHVEQLWRDYENFENSISRALAKGLISEYQPKYNSAKAVYREMKKYIDEIDWNMLAVPPSDWYFWILLTMLYSILQEEMQWTAWKRFLAFENVIILLLDTASANKRIVFAYEQCLMYLYHYPDIWYDYATWHAKCGSVDSAIKVYQRSLKALPDSEMLRYAYAELEESRGAIQAAKKVYESLMGDGTNATALSLIQFIRFLRRTEGVEAARKYFLDARKSPNCTYHVYVAQAMMEFCLNKDAKVARNVFEAGLKNFMHEPEYILEYADFLSRLNDDINIRALFERALSSLPPEESLEVWKRFSQFEQIYGDLASMLKVEQRRKEALSRTETFNYISLFTHHLLCQEFHPIQTLPSTLPYSGIQLNSNGQPPNVLGDVLKSLPPALAAFISNLPAVEGPSPDADFVISVCLQSNIPSVTSKPAAVSHSAQSGPVPSTSDRSDSSKFKTRDRLLGKRKDMDRQDDDDTSTVQSQPLPRDLFKIRQLHKSRVSSSHTGSVSYGSAISGELSGSTS
nr:cleavage stimulation factor subunit 77 isoform X1 [Ipomoea batatas]